MVFVVISLILRDRSFLDRFGKNYTSSGFLKAGRFQVFLKTMIRPSSNWILCTERSIPYFPGYSIFPGKLLWGNYPELAVA
jgi:hypothetical protein